MVLKDIWGLEDREVERTALWMADALVDAALRDSAAKRAAAEAAAASTPSPAPEWFDAQYNNRARIPEHPSILKYWADASAQALQRPGWIRDLAYGDDESERLDILPAASGAGKAPVFVYIHGGYWRALDKRDHAFLAPPWM